MAKVTLAGEEVTIADYSGRKALRAAHIARQIMAAWPDLLKVWQEFEKDYKAHNVVELDRTTAQLRYGPRPLLDDAMEPVRYPDTIQADEGKTVPHPRAGEIVMAPGDLDHMSDADWEASGQKLRLPKSPSANEIAVALFPLAFDKAEDLVLQLMALAVVPNADLARAAEEGNDAIDALLKRRANELLDGSSMAELMELAVVSAEFTEEQVSDKLKELGDRTRPLMRLFGFGRAQQNEPVVESAATTPSSSEPKPTSSTPSPAPTDGTSERSSTEPALSSS